MIAHFIYRKCYSDKLANDLSCIKLMPENLIEHFMYRKCYPEKLGGRFDLHKIDARKPDRVFHVPQMLPRETGWTI
jgi:hypothetical protein